MSHIDLPVKQVLIDGGFGDRRLCGGRILRRTGHGLGSTGHKAPYLAVGCDCELQPGMQIGIEPGICIPGLGGFRHSDSILVDRPGQVDNQARSTTRVASPSPTLPTHRTNESFRFDDTLATNTSTSRSLYCHR